MTDTTDKVAFAAAELLAASDALASAAAEIDALRAEVSRQTGIAVDHCARADAAEQMVAELRDMLETARDQLHHEVTDRHLDGDCVDGDGQQCSSHRVVDACADALSRTEAVAGRWVSVEVFKRHREALLRDMDRVGADVVKARAERDAAIAARDEAVREMHSSDSAARMLGNDFARVLRDCTAAERARDEVGIQLAAAQAEIARMRPVVEAARRLLWSWDEGSTATERSRQHEDIRRALRALDAVPGDTLAPRITAALEASGIDTGNVKGVE